jgi:hypothetical protein
MGAHKRPPPEGRLEIITPDFRELVWSTLKKNEAENKYRKLKPDDEDYNISNSAELAEAIGMDKTLLGRTIGQVKKGGSARLLKSSRFLGAIREALGLPIPVTVTFEVPAERADLVRALVEASDDDFNNFQVSVDRLIRDLIAD